MDDDAPSTSLNPDSPPFEPFQGPPPPLPPMINIPNIPSSPSPLLPIVFIPNFPPPPPTIPTYNPPPLHPYSYQYHSLHTPPQFSNYTYLVTPPPLLLQWSPFRPHYFEQQQLAAPPREEWADSRSIQDATTRVSVGPRISSCRENNVHRPEIGESSRRCPSAGEVPLKEEQHKTTIKIKSIPTEYTRERLLQFLDEHCKRENERDKETHSAYDFVFLPFYYYSRGKTRNKGYAFVNFTKPKAAWKFYEAFNGKPWNFCNCNSNQTIKIVTADSDQGKEALVGRYEQADFHCDKDECLPLLLVPYSDGSGTAPVNRRLVGKRISPS